MKREEFFNQLFASLEGLNDEERSRIKEYYTELLTDQLEEGIGEEEVIAHFGTPKEVAERIREEQEVREDIKENIPVNTAAARQAGVYEPIGEITSFQINAQDMRVHIYPAADGRFKILYRKGPDDEITVREENGHYIFRQEIPLLYKLLSFLRLGREGIRVEVPENVIRNFQVTTSNASVKVEYLLGFGMGRICTSNGRVILRNLQGNHIDVKTSNAGVSVEECKVDVLDARSSNGGISCQRCDGKRTSLRTSNAGIEVLQLQSKDIMLKSSNGSLKGTICGDPRAYSMDCGTSNGSCNVGSLKDERCENNLYAHTSNASVKLEFIY